LLRKRILNHVILPKEKETKEDVDVEEIFSKARGVDTTKVIKWVIEKRIGHEVDDNRIPWDKIKEDRHNQK
jgi:hypothetical protein